MDIINLEYLAIIGAVDADDLGISKHIEFTKE
jgi:hypothetical protein